MLANGRSLGSLLKVLIKSGDPEKLNKISKILGKAAKLLAQMNALKGNFLI